MCESPFELRSSLTIRSPNARLNDPATPATTDDKENLKKRRYNQINNESLSGTEEGTSNPHVNQTISNADIFNLIKVQSSKDSKERLMIKEELTNEIRYLNEKIVAIESNVSRIDKKVDAVTLLAEQNRKLINNLCQDKIDKCMEIDGIQRAVIEECQDLKKLALDTIASFKIEIAEVDINRVSKKIINYKDKDGNSNTKSILMVHFNEFDKKLKVMKEKRAVKENRKIYFNASLTATNRTLMKKAKNLISNKNLKIFFKNGKVHIEKRNKELMAIENDDDMLNLEQYVNSLNQSTSQINNQQSSSDNAM
jgi:hypothetical protein